MCGAVYTHVVFTICSADLVLVLLSYCSAVRTFEKFLKGAQGATA